MRRKMLVSVLSMSMLAGSVLFLAENARAVPSFKRQTGMACMVCHTAFPELTQVGRNFKLSGYTQSAGGKPFEYPPPIAAMVQLSYTEAKGLNTGVAPFNAADNDKINLPQQASLFYGGKIYGKTGAFVQLTYDGIGNDIALDNTDLRFADQASIGGKPLVYGLTVNNNPTVQDVWNTTPAWSFPFASSAVANTPAAHTVIDGTLAAQVGGIGAYGFWNNLLYGEITAYWSNRRGLTRPLGAGTVPDTVVEGWAPYWRVALQKASGSHYLSAGTYGIQTHIYPSGNTGGPTDRFTDAALDAQYQYVGKKNIFTLATTWIHEWQDWDASFPLGNTANSSDDLDTFRINGNYYYKWAHGLIGGTVGYFQTTGKSDPVLYAPAPVTGSGSGSPDSRGFIFQATYLPRDNIKVALQYVLYDKFNGAGSNYDGFGRDASDNDTLYLVVWLLF